MSRDVLLRVSVDCRGAFEWIYDQCFRRGIPVSFDLKRRIEDYRRADREAVRAHLRVIRGGLIALALGLTALPVAAEEFLWPAGTAGIVKGDLAMTLYQNGAPIADPGITVTEQANARDYLIAGAPDAAAGSSTDFCLTWAFDGFFHAYCWPQATRTPQAVVWREDWKAIPERLEMSSGDLAIPAQLRVSGLASNPTGSEVTFSMRKSSGGAAVVDAEAATIADIDLETDPVTGEQTWAALLTYQWQAGDTDVVGEYRGWFVVTFPGSLPLTLPPSRSLQVRIY